MSQASRSGKWQTQWEEKQTRYRVSLCVASHLTLHISPHYPFLFSHALIFIFLLYLPCFHSPFAFPFSPLYLFSLYSPPSISTLYLYPLLYFAPLHSSFLFYLLISTISFLYTTLYLHSFTFLFFNLLHLLLILLFPSLLFTFTPLHPSLPFYKFPSPLLSVFSLYYLSSFLDTIPSTFNTLFTSLLCIESIDAWICTEACVLPWRHIRNIQSYQLLQFRVTFTGNCTFTVNLF